MKLTDIDSMQSICTDTRFLQVGDVFVALKGANFDGHEFVKIAEDKGAVAVVVEHKVATRLPQIIVTSALQALQELGARRRSALDIPVVAITGSCGKTTTKNMLASILGQRGKTLVTEKNFNNDVGVPQTLLRLQPAHEFAVVEIGASYPQDVANLVKLVQPQVAVITNVAPVHIQGFGDLDGIAKAKGDILNGLDASGIAILNADDQYFAYWRERLRGQKIISFGIETKADVNAEQIELDSEGYASFVLHTPQGSEKISLAFLGRHNVMNALAAIAAALALNSSLAVIKFGLENCQPVAKRLLKRAGLNGAIILDDSYSANPRSTQVVLEVLAHMAGTKILVFGYMGELGADAEKYHRQIGLIARKLGINKLYGLGELTKFTVEAFGNGAYFFTEREKLIAALQSELQPGVTVLVKGSNVNKMWEIVERIAE
jgi:UDP-N-acetylmuramoyl-tripeptide--D-alanyl-D-alanine ligase